MLPSRFAFAIAIVATLVAAATATPAQETVGHLDPGREARHNKLLTPGATDTWPLELEADEVVQCAVESPEFDPVLSLADEQGAIVREEDGEGTRSLVRWRALRKGKHEFRVGAFRGSGGGTYTLTLLRFRTGPTASVAEATHTFDATRSWHFRVPLRRDDWLVPAVLGNARITEVLDDSLAPLPETLGAYRALRDGDCYLGIEGDEGCRVQLLTQLAHVENRQLDSSGSADVPAHGMRVLRLPVRAGSVFRLDLRVPPAMFNYSWAAKTQEGNNDAIATPAHFDKLGALRRFHVVRSDATLEFFLRNHAGIAASCSFATSRIGSPLQPGTTANAAMAVGNGTLFDLPLQAGQLVELQLHSDSFDGRLDLWDDAGNVVATNDDRAPGEFNPRLVFLAPRTAVWRLFAYTANAAGGGPFTVSCGAIEVPELRAGQQCDVVVQATTPAYVHVALQRDDVVWLAVSSTAFDAALQVLDPVGDGGFVREGGGVGGDVLTAYRATWAGTHTLLVHSRSGHGAGRVRIVQP